MLRSKELCGSIFHFLLTHFLDAARDRLRVTEGVHKLTQSFTVKPICNGSNDFQACPDRFLSRNLDDFDVEAKSDRGTINLNGNPWRP